MSHNQDIQVEIAERELIQVKFNIIDQVAGSVGSAN